MSELFLNIVVAHLICDFLFQNDSSCQNKKEKLFKSSALWFHAAIVFVVTWGAVAEWSFGWMAFIIAATHFLIDLGKSFIENKTKNNKMPIRMFVADQALHVVVLFVAVKIWMQGLGYEWTQIKFINSIPSQWIVIMIALFLSWKPANIFIRLLLKYYEVTQPDQKKYDSDNHGNFKSGALIGTLERWIIIFFFVKGVYEPIGFLMAAKSILRFNEVKENEKSEYVLAGTFLSIVLTLICCLIIVKQDILMELIDRFYRS